MRMFPELDTLKGMERLIRIVELLRSPAGCPWDREQTLDTLKPFLVEECYELIDAIDEQSPDRHQDELGDVLLQVLLQAQIRAETHTFDIHKVADHLADKLIRRHPHVFGNTHVNGTGDVLRNWEQIKRQEGSTETPRSAVAGIPRHLPALHKAQRIQARAAKVGFDWQDIRDVERKVDEELGELRDAMKTGNVNHQHEELGDLLFAVVNLARFLHVQAEDALNGAIAKFIRRFQQVEQRVHETGKKMEDCTLAELDAHWENVKTQASAQGSCGSPAEGGPAGAQTAPTP